MFYKDFIRSSLTLSPFSDALSYDSDGELWFHGLCLMDLVRKYGSPLEVTDTRMMVKRGAWWKEITSRVAKDCEFVGGFKYFYASKANMSYPYTETAYSHGWMAETSSGQDLEHIRWMYEQGKVDTRLEIISNGFKLAQNSSDGEADTLKSTGVSFADKGDVQDASSYAESILLMHSLGFPITPVLDTGELNYFLRASLPHTMNVGLRLKFGQVHDDLDLSRLISRHGMMWEELLDVAADIERSSNLNFSMLHVMVGAAESIDVDTFVQSLLFAVEKYFQLKRFFPSLKYLNLGGGVPPYHSGFDYELFLTKFLAGVVSLSKQFGLEMPCLVYELGSFMADDCGMRIYKVTQRKVNHVSETGLPEVWCTVDGGLMSALPDMFIMNKSFKVLALNNGTASLSKCRLGDLSCDSDGRFPRKGMDPDTVVLPDTDKEMFIAVFPLGAYQKMLSGAGGAHHCGILEAGQVVIEEKSSGVHVGYIPPQTSEEYQRLLGYTAHQEKRVNVMDTKKTDNFVSVSTKMGLV